MATDITQSWTGSSGAIFTDRPFHRLWLLKQARSLFEFFLPASHNPAGGFHSLNNSGRQITGVGKTGQMRPLHATSRMVHCAAIGYQLGIPGMDRTVDHGLRFLWERHRDKKHSGYFWGVDDTGACDATKQAYGHAFVLLAAASAKAVEHPDAARLLADVTEVLCEHFWESTIGATTEEYRADWESFSQYRGQNSNMHLTEALMAAFEVTRESQYLEMAQSIAELIINTHARAEGWRVPEHFDVDWRTDRTFAGNPMFRPKGITPGHAMEWSRLLIQLWELDGRQKDWMLPAAQSLFLTACEHGWDKPAGGFYYTLTWDNLPDQSDRYWWPCCEGIAAASVLQKVSADPRFELWYRRIWGFVQNHFIDSQEGGWFAELDDALQPVERVFRGKPDLYHAVQACLIPLLPTNGSVTHHLKSEQAHLLLTGDQHTQSDRSNFAP